MDKNKKFDATPVTPGDVGLNGIETARTKVQQRAAQKAGTILD